MLPRYGINTADVRYEGLGGMPLMLRRYGTNAAEVCPNREEV